MAVSALAAVPSGAGAGAFWQLDPGGALAPGVVIERSAFTVAAGGAAGHEVPTRLFVDLPRIASRLGLLFSQDDGRPSLDGLAWKMARNLRVSAKGDYDMDDGEISGEVNLHFDF